MTHPLARQRTAGAFSVRRAASLTFDDSIIGRASIFFGGGGTASFTALRIGFGIDVDPPGWFIHEDPALFESHAITPADVGRTFWETAGSDSNFTTVAARLTNGVDDWAFLRVFELPFTGSGGGAASEESVAFSGSTGLTSGIDFAGHTIVRIGMRVDSLRFFEKCDDIGGEQVVEYHHEGWLTIVIQRQSTRFAVADA